MTTFPLLLMQRDRFVFSAWIVTYPKAVVLSKSLATEKRKVLVNVFFPVGSLVKRAIFFAPVKVKKIERKKRKNPRYGKHICQFLGPIECCHMTSRRPYWCPKTMRRRPCWSPKPILWELSSFLDFHFNSNKRITGANQNSRLGTYSNTNVILKTTEWMICKVPSLYYLHHFPPLAAVFLLGTSWITLKIVAF